MRRTRALIDPSRRPKESDVGSKFPKSASSPSAAATITTLTVSPLASEIESLVLALHRRNGGKLAQLDWDWRLLEPALGIDSLDLAEIVVALERRFRVSLFDLPSPPRTWNDVLRAITQNATPASP